MSKPISKPAKRPPKKPATPQWPQKPLQDQVPNYLELYQAMVEANPTLEPHEAWRRVFEIYATEQLKARGNEWNSISEAPKTVRTPIAEAPTTAVHC
jgi:hypothetical protein